MRYGFLLLLLSIILNTSSCASDLETVPLLGPNKSGILDDDGEKIYPLEAVVVDLKGRSPHGILLPDGQARTACGLGRDIWLNILSQLDRQYLLSMRLVNTFFHRLLTQPSPTHNPLGEELLMNLIDARFNEYMPKDALPLQQFAQALSSVVHDLSRSPLLVRYLDRLEPHGKPLWRLRYVPGMNVGDLRQLLTDLNMPADDSLMNWFNARQLASLHTSRLRGGLAEAAKATLVLGSAGLCLWLIWSKPLQLPTSCQSIYVFPSQLLDGQISKIASADLQNRSGGTVVTGLSLLWYFSTFIKCDLADPHGKPFLKFRKWGKLLSYGEWAGIINSRDSAAYIGAKRLVVGVVMPLFAGILIVSMLGSYLQFDLTTVFTGQMTIARYIHEELKYGLSQNASCCAMAIDSLIGGSCPRIDADKIPDFGQLISTAKVVQGLASADILSLSFIACHVLIVMGIAILNMI